jgi:adhesin transport system outer membrane protein
MRNNYIKKLKYILYCVILLTSIGASITLEEVIQENINANPQIRVSLANYEASKYELTSANAGYNPTLDLRAETGKERTEVDYSFAGSRELNERQVALVGRYNLFEGYKTKHKVNEKRSELEVSKNQLLKKVNKISAFMVQVYLELLRRNSLV